MTTDGPRESTEGTTMCTGEYKCMKAVNGKEEPCRPSTSDGGSRGNRVRKVHIGTKSGSSPQSVKIAVDVAAEDRKGRIADLNERLKRLRCRK